MGHLGFNDMIKLLIKLILLTLLLNNSIEQLFAQVNLKYEIGYKYYSGLSGSSYAFHQLNLDNADSTFTWLTVYMHDAAFSGINTKTLNYRGKYFLKNNTLNLIFEDGDSDLSVISSSYNKFKICKNQIRLKNKRNAKRNIGNSYAAFLDSDYKIKESIVNRKKNAIVRILIWPYGFIKHIFISNSKTYYVYKPT